jgi:HK97 family phage portal protein
VAGPWRRLMALIGIAESRTLDFPFNVGPPAYGGSVSVETALTLAPVYAAARLLADSVASLPLQAYRDSGGQKVRITLPPLFAQPAMTGTLYDWLYAMMTSLVLQGNAYGLVTRRDGHQYPTGIEWLATNLVAVDEQGPVPRYFYEGKELPREDVFHVRAFVLAGCVKGVSPVSAFATMIGSGIAAEKYSSDWFDNGGIPPGTFKNSRQTVDPAAADEITGRLVNKIRSRKPLVYGADWDYNALSLPPGEVQFIESMQLTATQIAAIYGIPPERIGGTRGSSLTYATQEQEEIAFVTTTLRPWLVRLEQAFFQVLPVRQYVRFNVDAMLRVDAMTRRNIYKIDREIGLSSIDEMRALEEKGPLPDGEGQEYAPLMIQVAEAKTHAAQPVDVQPSTGQPQVPARPRAVS